MSLTGKIRYRPQKRLFRDPVLVLQVEEKYTDYDPDGSYFGSDRYFWRDAKVEDINVMEDKNR